MKTEVIMQRTFLDGVVRQRSQSEHLSATDIVRIGRKYRLNNNLSDFNLTIWLNKQGTIDFIKELKKNFSGEMVIKSKGRNGGTWLHPFLFIDLALAINPTFKVSVYQWLYDNLLKYRNDSGDSYKRMAGSLIRVITNKQYFHKKIVEIASNIKKACKVNNWQEATENQLELRDKIQDNISLLADVLTDVDKAVEIGIHKAMNNL